MTSGKSLISARTHAGTRELHSRSDTNVLPAKPRYAQIDPVRFLSNSCMLSRFLIALAVFLSAQGREILWAQVVAPDDASVAAADDAHRWRLAIGESEPLERLDERRLPDSLEHVVSDLLHRLQVEGYLDARIDSVSSHADSLTVLYASSGSLYRIRTLKVEGARKISPQDIKLGMRTQEGAPLNMEVLEADIEELLDAYDRLGLLTAEAKIRAVTPFREKGEAGIDLTIVVDEGRQPVLSEVRAVGARRTRSAFVARKAELDVGNPVSHFQPDVLRNELEGTGLFESVEQPSMLITETGEAVLVVALEEGPPGNFDAVLGYLPATGPEGNGSIIGNVDVSLRHLFGLGRSFAFKFNRLPARVTRVSFSGEDPHIAGRPVRGAVAFDGYQRDSTFTRQQWNAEAGYEIVRGVELFATLSRERTRPGVDSLINVPRSNAWFAGLGFSVDKLDNPRNPRSGWSLTANFARGRKARKLSGMSTDQTTASGEAVLRQKRLMVDTRVFVPLRGRQTVLVAMESALLESGVYDESDLFRLGGANSLRGYNEEQFIGNVAGRGTVEWRYLLDPTSFIFAFFDLGFLGKPAAAETLQTLGTAPAEVDRWALHPGYGLGIRFGTNAGLFSVSLALNPEDGLGTKVHVGISLGL